MAEDENLFLKGTCAALAEMTGRRLQLVLLIDRLEKSSVESLVKWKTGMGASGDQPAGDSPDYGPLIEEIVAFLMPLVIPFDYANWKPFQDDRIRERDFLRQVSPIELAKFITSWNRIEHWTNCGWAELVSGERPWLLELALKRLLDILEMGPENA